MLLGPGGITREHKNKNKICLPEGFQDIFENTLSQTLAMVEMLKIVEKL